MRARLSLHSAGRVGPTPGPSFCPPFSDDALGLPQRQGVQVEHTNARDKYATSVEGSPNCIDTMGALAVRRGQANFGKQGPAGEA